MLTAETAEAIGIQLVGSQQRQAQAPAKRPRQHPLLAVLGGQRNQPRAVPHTIRQTNGRKLDKRIQIWGAPQITTINSSHGDEQGRGTPLPQVIGNTA